MKQKYLKEVRKLRRFSHVDKKIIDRFIKRINSTDNLTKEKGSSVHFCSFFVPVNKQSKSVYLGHHIKADDWIPPGGHIRFGETPLQTLYREFTEELKHQLTNETIELFDLSIKDVSKNPRHSCKLHYDFWHIVYTDKIPFVYDTGEFHEAGWFTLDEAHKKTKLKQYNKIIQKIKAFI